jgi:hypothetical protein
MEKITKLLEKNVNEFTEKKNNLTYLSWANAWKIALQEDENISYEVDKYDGKPYLFDENLGYIVSTKVTMFGKTLPMILPVMDNTNKAMKSVVYEYETRAGKRKVEPATMFDINTAIMRCLVKNLALFGLGLYIYAGEDLPDGEDKPTEPVSDGKGHLETNDDPLVNYKPNIRR